MIGCSRLLACMVFALALGPALIANAIAGPVDMMPINAMDRAAFVVKFGGIFEKSPWVAEEAWERRPFASPDEMHAAMVAVAKTAPATRQLALLQAHPDLAGKEAQAGTMTASSVAEQAGAGLNALPPPEFAELSNLNAAYKAKFGFPFIICVRRHDKRSILAAFGRRLARDEDAERDQALNEIGEIVRLRLADLIEDA